MVAELCSSSAALLFPAASAVWLPADRSALARSPKHLHEALRVGRPRTDFPLPVHVIDRRRCRKGLTCWTQRTTECFSSPSRHFGASPFVQESPLSAGGAELMTAAGQKHPPLFLPGRRFVCHAGGLLTAAATGEEL